MGNPRAAFQGKMIAVGPVLKTTVQTPVAVVDLGCVIKLDICRERIVS
jgi:hypothetical protein